MRRGREAGCFADRLMRQCGRTVESGRCLTEYWLRILSTVAVVGMYHYKYHRFSILSTATIFVNVTLPLSYRFLVSGTAECLYTTACRVLDREFAALNLRAAAVMVAAAAGTDGDDDDVITAAAVVGLSDAHGRLTRLVRLFGDEYAVPVLVTTVNLLFRQIYVLNDAVSVIVDGDAYDSDYIEHSYIGDALAWIVVWFQLWWICYRVDGLVTQASGTRTGRPFPGIVRRRRRALFFQTENAIFNFDCKKKKRTPNKFDLRTKNTSPERPTFRRTEKRFSSEVLTGGPCTPRRPIEGYSGVHGESASFS